MGLLEAEARRLNAPYLKLVDTGRPWIIAKWAMTLDGKIATQRARAAGFPARSRGRSSTRFAAGSMRSWSGGETAVRDDPLLTARPPGPRTAVRVVLDTRRTRSAATANWCGPHAKCRCWWRWGEIRPPPIGRGLTDAGCEVFVCAGETHAARLDALLAELGGGE